MILMILEIIFILINGNQNPNGFGFPKTNPFGPKIKRGYHSKIIYISGTQRGVKKED
jgi:hypothetical protein